MKTQQQLLVSLLDKFKTDLPKSQQTLLKTLFVIICSIIVKENVNLNKLKNQVGVIADKNQTLANSHYRRLTRFFDALFCKHQLWKMILKTVIQQLVSTLDKRKMSKYLLLDGTSWEFGKTKFYFLTLSIVYQGISVPIFFINLAKKGCSDHLERKRLLLMANCLYPLKGMTLIADREYIGRQWFSDLIEQFELNFVIRISETDYKLDLQNQGKSYAQLLKKARKGKLVEQTLTLGNQTLRMIATRNQTPEKQDDSLIILITNLPLKKQKILSIYKLRWQIECMFKCLKSNGFNVEMIAFKDKKKIRLIFCIVIACYVLCVSEGLKNFKKITVRQKYESIFRKGYSLISKHCQQLVLFLEWCLEKYNTNKIRPKPA